MYTPSIILSIFSSGLFSSDEKLYTMTAFITTSTTMTIVTIARSEILFSFNSSSFFMREPNRKYAHEYAEKYSPRYSIIIKGFGKNIEKKSLPSE